MISVNKPKPRVCEIHEEEEGDMISVMRIWSCSRKNKTYKHPQATSKHSCVILKVLFHCNKTSISSSNFCDKWNFHTDICSNPRLSTRRSEILMAITQIFVMACACRYDHILENIEFFFLKKKNAMVHILAIFVRILYIYHKFFMRSCKFS